MKPKVILVIPARYASVRFPGKPLIPIAGKPMIQHVWEQCTKSALADRIIVATDDERIASVVRSFGGEAVLTNPALASGSERVAAVAREIEGDIFVNVQGDEPMMPPDTIDAVIRPLHYNPSIDIGTAALSCNPASIANNSNVVKVVCTADGRALYFSRAAIPFHRDDGKPTWHRGSLKHIGIYAFRRASLLRFAELPESPLERSERLEQLRALESGMHIHVEIVEYDSIAVDVPEDVERVVSALKLKGLA